MTENTVQSKFKKVLGTWDVIFMAFGAMIGWGWVVSTGSWIESGGVIGAALGFVIGGIMIFFVGNTYAELIGMMPQCGGENVYTYRAMGSKASFLCTWAMILGYVSVVCFESCTLPMIVSYIWPDFLQGYLYTISGYDVYITQVILAAAVAIFMTYINIRGTKFAAVVQTAFTLMLALVGILVIAGGVISGDTANIASQAFVGDDLWTMIAATMTVAMITPFFYIGFDVIPQAAEEINIPLRKIGKIILLSVGFAVVFYALIIVAVGLILTPEEIAASMGSSGLVTADALAKAFSSDIMAKVCLVGGLCGILTSWNSFIIGGSRALYAMAVAHMIPHFFSKLHKKFNTPVTALLLIGLLSVLAPLLGRKMLTWIVDAGNFGCCVTYLMVALSFLILRKKEPDFPRPYKVKHYKIVGVIAVLMTAFMVAMYIIPNSGASLTPVEWVMVGGWLVAGLIFGAICKKKYGDEFAKLKYIEVDHSDSI